MTTRTYFPPEEAAASAGSGLGIVTRRNIVRSTEEKRRKRQIHWPSLESNVPYSPRTLTRLSGPSIASFYGNLAGKRILLLGEIHEKPEAWCHPGEDRNYVEVEQYLVDLAEIAPECLDVMVETSYIKELEVERKREQLTLALREKTLAPTSKIYSIESRFADCVAVENCHGGRVRYHFVDIRRIFWHHGLVPFSDLRWYLDYNYARRSAGYSLIPRVYDRVQYKKILMFLCGQDTPGTNPNLAAYIDFVRDQLKKVDMSDCEIDCAVEEGKYVERTAEGILKKEIGKMDGEVVPDTEFFFSKLCDSIIAFEEIMQEGHIRMYRSINTIRMDAYMLARLFVKFDGSKMGRGPIHCRGKESERIRNAILYTGAEHTRHYSRFFMEYFGKGADRFEDVESQRRESCLRFDPPFDYWQ